MISKSCGALGLLSVLIASSLAQDNGCSSQAPLPAGSGPVATPDTPVRTHLTFRTSCETDNAPQTAFYDQSAIRESSTSAEIPANYTLAYSNLQASSNAQGYQGYSLLNSYNVSECARVCNTNDRCIAFNILFERSPSVVPGAETCTDPPSTSMYHPLSSKCKY